MPVKARQGEERNGAPGDRSEAEAGGAPLQARERGDPEPGEDEGGDLADDGAPQRMKSEVIGAVYARARSSPPPRLALRPRP